KPKLRTYGRYAASRCGSRYSPTGAPREPPWIGLGPRRDEGLEVVHAGPRGESLPRPRGQDIQARPPGWTTTGRSPTSACAGGTTHLTHKREIKRHQTNTPLDVRISQGLRDPGQRECRTRGSTNVIGGGCFSNLLRPASPLER